MSQPNANVDVRLEARYSVIRVGIRQKQAVLLNVSRREVVIEVGERDGADVIQAGDTLELEILLPQFYGVPQRCLYCRCNVDMMESSATGNRLELTVDRMQFRGGVIKPLGEREIDTLVM